MLHLLKPTVVKAIAVATFYLQPSAVYACRHNKTQSCTLFNFSDRRAPAVRLFFILPAWTGTSTKQKDFFPHCFS